MLHINSGGGIVMISTPQARYSHAMSWVFYFQYFWPIFMCLSPSGKCQCWTAIISTFKRTNNDQWDWNTTRKRSFMLFLKRSLSFFSIRREDLHIQFGDIWGKWQKYMQFMFLCHLCEIIYIFWWHHFYFLFPFYWLQRLSTFGSPPPSTTYFTFLMLNIFAIGLDDSILIRCFDSKKVIICQIFSLFNYLCWNLGYSDASCVQTIAHLKGHQKRITCLAFSQNLNVLVSSGADAQVSC